MEVFMIKESMDSGKKIKKAASLTGTQPGSFLAPERQRGVSLYMEKKLTRSVRCCPGNRE